MRIYQINILNPMSDFIVYAELDKERRLFGDQIFHQQDYIVLKVSDNKNMNEKYDLSISPQMCSYIAVKEVEE